MVLSAGQVSLLLVTFLMSSSVEGVKPQNGHIRLSQVNDDYICRHETFKNRFIRGTPVSVFASVNRGNGSSYVYDSIFLWVEDVKYDRFKACVVEGGQEAGDNFTIDWFAVQGPQTGAEHGKTPFSKFTTGSQCNRVTFKKGFKKTPTVHVTVQHTKKDRKYDAMLVWIENISPSEFEVCLQESRVFDGLHEGLIANWMAYENYPQNWRAKESKTILFSGKELPSAENKYALCKTIKYDEPFFNPPIVLTTVFNAAQGNKSNNGCGPKQKEPLLTWMEGVTKKKFQICIIDHAGYGNQRSDVVIDYLIIGDLDPCRNINCTYESFCYARDEWTYECRCRSNCPSYEEHVCGSNGRTFRNMCDFKQTLCEERGNYTNYHPGRCNGFPMQKGRHEFPNPPPGIEDQCVVIKFKPFVFYPLKEVHVQLTVNHFNYSYADWVHEAATPWVESVNITQFTACVTRTGKNKYLADSFPSIDWMAYQGNPPGGVAGEANFTTWSTGTSCVTVPLSPKRSEPPSVFATAVHHRTGLRHDATSLWLEDVSTSSFQICLREFQNFAGAHDKITASWLFFEKTPRPWFKEHGLVSFPNTGSPLEEYNYAFCKDVSYTRSAYKKPPKVFISASHSTSGGNAPAECNGIVSWIEYITEKAFRICVKELEVQRFDPLNVSYAVLGDSICKDDWYYFDNYCYSQVAACDNWDNSYRVCGLKSADLPSIRNQEENVFVQSLHGGEHSWLGLNDINSEGNFVWSDKSTSKFRRWAKDQPNNYGNQDCVHALGFLKNHHYEWNDVNCSDCHRYSCKRDYDECADQNYDCPADSHCVNEPDGYDCQCNKGFFLNANKKCEDWKECDLGSSFYTCPAKSTCENVPGSYRCRCELGLAGTGLAGIVKECGAPYATVTSSCADTTIWLSNSTGYIEPIDNSKATKYKSYMNCTWNITSNGQIDLVFLRLDTEDKQDKVFIHDGGSTSAPVIGTLFGDTTPQESFTSTFNNLFVRFESDASKEYRGFLAEYRAITDGSVRMNSTSSHNKFTGRVEVFYDGKWGTVCHDNWDRNAANVVCRELGFKLADRAFTSAAHGEGSGPIWLDDVRCSGSETHLHKCNKRKWGDHDCTHKQDASMKCSFGSTNVRISGGRKYGRVEVLIGGQWGTICDHKWDMNDATVICRQLGYKGAHRARGSAIYGQGSGPIHRNLVRCKGDEKSLLDCPYGSSRYCSHAEDAGVECNI